MAESKCPSCNSRNFEMQKKIIQNGNDKYEFTFVQCAKCGAVLGVLQTKAIAETISYAANTAIDNINNSINKAIFNLMQALPQKKE